MARLARLSSAAQDSDTNRRRHGSNRAADRALSLSPSPAASVSSDKENREAATGMSNKSNEKGKVRAVPTPECPTPRSAAEIATPRTNKRRRVEGRGAPTVESQAVHQRELNEVADTQYYDPEQAPEERRAVRKGLRDLTRELNDSRAEYLAPGSTGLADTLHRANQYFSAVKQTSDATLDSRLLVSTADLSYKKTTQLTLGDASQGIDLDEFVSKCITFMRRGPREEDETAHRSGRNRRQANARRAGEVSDDEDSADEGDAFNWDYLGRQLCFPHNLRPPVPGFLLGPLSVQKRVRKPIQRRERLQQRNPAEVVHPEELQKKDLEKAENSNLTTLCNNIRELLRETQAVGEVRVETEATDNMTEAETQALMEKHHMCDDGGVSMFPFVINPHSFGQTVENLFYVSFLIRDGWVRFGKDARGLPTLHHSEPSRREEIEKYRIQKHQTIFHLDYSVWEDLIEVFGITNPMIPNRSSDEGVQVSTTSWYG